MDGNSVDTEIVSFHTNLQQQIETPQSFMDDSCSGGTKFFWKVGNQKLDLR